jgi:putative adenylate-forming enzyme
MQKLQILFFLLQYAFRSRFPNRERLRRFQERQWRRFRGNVLVKSPFYRDLALKNAPLEDFPLMDKTAFMAQFNAINTLGVDKDMAMNLALRAEEDRNFSPTLKGGITVGLSTGTSGKRGLFLVSPRERAQWAARVLRQVVPIRFSQKQKVAFFLRANSNLYSAVQSRVLEFRYFDIFRPLDELAKDLADFQPDVLAAQPSILGALAKKQKEKTIHISPQRLVSFAEVLWDDEREMLKNTWPDAQFCEVYQCTEGFLGCTCEHGTMHLNEDLVMIEKRYLDERRFVPIITDFTRNSQPIVRYELNDVLVEKPEPCPCGSPFTALERIEGRCDDVLEFKRPDGTVFILIPDLLCRLIARETDDFDSYQLAMNNSGQILLYLEAASLKWEAVSTQVAALVLRFLAENGVLEVELSCHQGSLTQIGQKRKRVLRLS